MRSTGLVIALVIGVFALYWTSLRNPPVFDDVMLTANFLRSYGESWFKGDLRWFTYVTFGWTTRIFGEDWFWQRLGNLVLHAAVVAALFAVHPVAVYAVAYLMQRSIVMATLGRRCVVLMRVQRYADALADCLRAVELSPYDTSNYTSLGMVHALRGDASRAESHYRRALELDPRSADAHYQYAVLLSRTDRGAQARPHFVAACRAGIRRACDAASR